MLRPIYAATPDRRAPFLPPTGTNGILLRMPSTTIKVDARVRDRLAERARRNGRSAGDELAALMDRLEAIEAWSHAATNYHALPAAARDELHQHELLAAHHAAAAHA
jgi:hypothetical protein